MLEAMPSFLLCLYFKELVLLISIEDINLILKLPFHITWLSSSKLQLLFLFLFVAEAFFKVKYELTLM